jgi:hypothetical protein
MTPVDQRDEAFEKYCTPENRPKLTESHREFARRLYKAGYAERDRIAQEEIAELWAVLERIGAALRPETFPPHPLHSRTEQIERLVDEVIGYKKSHFAKLTAANERIEALERYAQHERTCRRESWSNDGPCTCGLDAMFPDAPPALCGCDGDGCDKQHPSPYDAEGHKRKPNR